MIQLQCLPPFFSRQKFKIRIQIIYGAKSQFEREQQSTPNTKQQNKQQQQATSKQQHAMCVAQPLPPLSLNRGATMTASLLDDIYRPSQEEKDSHYKPGSIKRVKLTNFLTYDAVEFFPGPR